MPAKGGYPSTWKSPGVHVVAGKFETNGASAPTNTTGAGFTVSAPDASGVYTVTLTDGPFSEILSLVVKLESAPLNSTFDVRLKQNFVSTNGTFTVVTMSAAGTDAQLAAGHHVNFIAVLLNSGARK